MMRSKMTTNTTASRPMRTAPSSDPARRSGMLTRGPTISLTAMRNSALSTMPVSRKMPANATQVCAGGNRNWSIRMGDKYGAAATASGAAAR